MKKITKKTTKVIPTKIKTSILRNTYKQQKYRKQPSRSESAGRHVAHIMDLELAVYILKFAKGRPPTKYLKSILNDKSNFRMVKKETNLIEHKKIVRSLIKKSKKFEPLTIKEKKRIEQQMNFLMKHDLPKGFIIACKKFYNTLGVTLNVLPSPSGGLAARGLTS